MKKALFFLSLGIALCCASINVHAQVIDPKTTAENDATDRTNSNISSQIDNGLGKTEGAIKGLFKKKKKTDATAANAAGAPSGAAGFAVYNNYDFVPGDKILFEDNFTEDQVGEFPSHWKLSAGQAVINKLGDAPAFMLTDGNYCRVAPLMKSPSYLSDPFTIEYDQYGNGAYPVQLYFYARPNYDGDENFNMKVDPAYVSYSIGGSPSLNADLPLSIRDDNFNNKWHHIAISYKNQQMKIYVDQYRVLVIPHTSFVPVDVEVASIGDQVKPVTFKNFRIASGGDMNMLGKKFTDAKIVTHGINFDIDKATIKPESMGTLNMIVSVMKDNPDVKFEVDGHTDNTGTSPHNQQLSQDRADAVRLQLITMGIDGSRLISKGYGDTKPISDNVTIEGKANNRRVEFVKI